MRARMTSLIALISVAIASPVYAQDGGVPDAGPPITDDAGAPAADAGEETRDAPADESDGGAGGEPGEAPAEGEAQSGIRGRIVDSRTGEGLPDAVVIAQSEEGASGTAMTNETGGYVLTLDPGLYTVSALYDLYHGARMPRVRVRSERWSDLTLTLDPIDDTVVAEEVEIVYRADTESAAAQDQLRAESSGISEGMGSQQMSRSGAGDAGSAARSAVGVSIEGTNLNIRGLGGRYTVVLLNGVQLPSTDPDFPSVDLDLFPTSVIDSLVISKAFQADLPANFAGGVLDIRTVRFPREFTFELSGGVRFNTESTFREVFGYRGGDHDWLGFDDGSRRMPSGLDNRVAVSRGGPYQSFEAVEEIAERFANNWALSDQTLPPGFNLELTLGDVIDLGSRNRLGYLVTAGYDYMATFQPNASARLMDATGGDNDAYRYPGGRTLEAISLNALGTASLEIGQDDAITLLTLFNRVADDEAQHQSGYAWDLGGNVERWQLSYLARTMWFTQLRGDHRNMLGSRLRLRWNVYGSFASREEPDRRSVTYGPNGSLTRRWLEKSQSGERFYSDLTQLDFGGLADLRFPLWSEAWADVGVHLRHTSRDFLIRRFRMMQDPSNMDQSAYQADVSELFDEQGIGTLTRLQEFSRNDDSYDAEQLYFAGYAQAETPIYGPLSLTVGARVEVFDQSVANQSPIPSERETGTEEIAGTDRTDVDVLPAGSLRLELMERMNLRAAYGMTVGRPQIRELAPYQYYDFIRDRNVQGNPELARTLIQNADLRWEWFFGEGEVLAFSVFYKYFDQPIELQIRNQQNYDSQFINAQFAHNVGGEVELRFNFRHFAPELSVLSFEGNFTLLWSTVQLPEALSGAVRSERPLYGQAPYVANLSLHFDEPGSGIRASVIYNVTGPRLTDVGTRVGDVFTPDIYREPYHQLDFVLTWQADEHLRLRLKLQNILAFQSQQWIQGADLGFEVARQQAGMTASLTAQYSY
jgi:outer membrane receptor protein involved in Fe transport